MQRKILLTPEYKKSLLFLLKWAFIAILSGFIGTVIVHLFNYTLSLFHHFFQQTFSFVPVWTIGGAILCGAVIYRLAPGSAGEGIPSYLKGIHLKKGHLNGKDTFFKFWAALITLGTFGNGGVVGPLGRVSAGIMSAITSKLKKLQFSDWDIRTATICGLAATVGTIFHSSIGGGIFAVEIVQKTEMRYRDIFPAILSSSTAVFLSKTFGWSSFYTINPVNEFMHSRQIWGLLLFSFAIGFIGKLYTELYRLIARIFQRETNRHILLKVVIGSSLAAFIAWFINPALLGTSKGLIEALFSENKTVLFGNIPETVPFFIILLIMAVIKSLGNCITVGSGMSAGFTGPSAIIGMLFGAAWSHIFRIVPGTADYTSFIAAGFAGMLASTMNIPLAAGILTIESFGLQYSFPAGVAAIIAFQINQHETIYDYAVSQMNKLNGRQ